MQYLPFLLPILLLISVVLSDDDVDCIEEDDYNSEYGGNSNGPNTPFTEVGDEHAYTDGNNGHTGVCLLEKGKCPDESWRMFKRSSGESVCLKVYGSRSQVDAVTAARDCRKRNNARLMSIDSFEEKEWLNSKEIYNGTYLHVLVAGNRHRKCRDYYALSNCKPPTMFDYEDRSANKTYVSDRLLPHHRWTEGVGNSCMIFWISNKAKTGNLFEDWHCSPAFNLWLCGITVMQ